MLFAVCFFLYFRHVHSWLLVGSSIFFSVSLSLFLVHLLYSVCFFARRVWLQCGRIMCFSVHNMGPIPASFGAVCCRLLPTNIEHTLFFSVPATDKEIIISFSMQIFNVNFCARIWRNKNRNFNGVLCVHRFQHNPLCIGNTVTELKTVNSRNKSILRCQYIAYAKDTNIRTHSNKRNNLSFRWNIKVQKYLDETNAVTSTQRR